MKKVRLALVVLASAAALTAPRVPAQTRPRLADYFTTIPPTVLDAGYVTQSIFPVSGDVNGDGYQDLIVLGASYPGGGATCCTPQPGRVFLGDGDGHFSPAPRDLIPVDTLMTVHPRKVLFADFNADGRNDMFISAHGWDADPFPGEQNRLYLSRPDGGWRDATADLPQVSDFSHSSSAGDISARGLLDIFVGNGFGPIAPYFLLNTGSGQFTQTRTNIPAGANQVLDPSTGHGVAGATLADLNGDGLAELIVTGTRTSIFWNRAGVFFEADTTQLPLPLIFGNAHTDLDVQRIDVNRDGLPDLVLVGTQGNPSAYDGWFVQILINQGNRQFIDETTLRLPRGEASGGREGFKTNAPWPMAVRVLDFNQDGASDFAVDFRANGSPFSQGQPLVWLNDGAGHFSALKAGDFVTAGNETLVLGGPRLMATRHGYSFIEPRLSATGGLVITGLLATRPFRMAGPSPAPIFSSARSSIDLSSRPRPADAGDMNPVSLAADVMSLTFDRPPAQGPGTSGVAFISDPTIQPFVSPGVPAPLSAWESIDLQGNGRPDLVVCHGSFPPMPAVPGPCRVLRPQSDGSIVEITRQLFGAGALPSLIGPSGIVSGDFNRDGRPDIFISGGGYDMSPWPGETNILLISNADGTYTDRSATLPQTPAFYTVPTVGDINGDGNLDIYVGAIFGANRVGPYFLLGKGDGTFTQKTGGLPAQIQNLQEKFGPSLLIDVDQDGSPDLVLGTAGDGGHIDNIVLFNDGTGDFTRRPRLVLPHGSQLPADNSVTGNIASLDVNLDGRPDLLMLSTTHSFVGFGLQMLINQGNGTFVDETAARLGPSVARLTGPRYPFIRLADFNGDGLQDLYLPYAYDPDPSAYPRFWLNNGNGTFASIAPSTLPAEFGSAYASMYAVDFDGDRRPDIVQLGAPSLAARTPSGEYITYRSFLNRTGPASVTSNVNFPPRNETNDFNTQLENLYRDRLGASPTSSYVDLEGANVWLTEYARYRVGQCAHADAQNRVFAQIRAGVAYSVCAITPGGSIPFPPRNEGLDFMTALDAVYRDELKRSPSPVYVNNEGRVVWVLEYLRYRLNGCGHSDATVRVFQQILGQGIQPTCS